MGFVIYGLKQGEVGPLGQRFRNVQQPLFAQNAPRLSQRLIHYLQRKMVEGVEEDHEIEALCGKIESFAFPRQEAQVRQGLALERKLQLLRRGLQSNALLKPPAHQRPQEGSVTASHVQRAPAS